MIQFFTSEPAFGVCLIHLLWLFITYYRWERCNCLCNCWIPWQEHGQVSSLHQMKAWTQWDSHILVFLVVQLRLVSLAPNAVLEQSPVADKCSPHSAEPFWLQEVLTPCCPPPFSPFPPLLFGKHSWIHMLKIFVPLHKCKISISGSRSRFFLPPFSRSLLDF